MSTYAPKQGLSQRTTRCPSVPRGKLATAADRDSHAVSGLPRDPGPRTIPRFLLSRREHAAPALGPVLERPVASPEPHPSGGAAAAERQADELGGRIAAELPGVAVGAGPLPRSFAAVAERHLGIDLSGARIEVDGTSGRDGASRVPALARGTTITYAQGKPSTRSEEGRYVLGHELTHVAQQRAAGEVVPQGYHHTAACSDVQVKSAIGPGNSLAYQMARDAKNALDKPIPPGGSNLSSLLARHAQRIWGMKIGYFDGWWHFVSKADQETARQHVAEAFTLAKDAFERNDYTYNCRSFCSGSDYGLLQNLGDRTIHLCPSAIGERQPPDATVSKQAALTVETAALTILHEFFHVVFLGHPHAEEYAQLGYELRFGKAPPIEKVDSAGGGTATE